jgi:hypothetical protein
MVMKRRESRLAGSRAERAEHRKHSAYSLKELLR